MRPTRVRSWLLVAVVLVSLVACDDGDATAPAQARATRTSATQALGNQSAAPATTTPEPSPLAHLTVATQPVPSDIQGIALFGHHVAYVEGEERLVLMDWRTGERRTVHRTTYGSLFLLGTSGRFVNVLDQRPSPAGDDPASPHRFLSLDLVSGRTSTVQLPLDAHVVGELNDIRLEVVRPRHEGADPWRGDLVEVWQQPDPDSPDRPLTASGLVVEAGMGDHRIAWTQRLNHRDADAHTVWTLDLFHPRHKPLRLARTPEHVPYAPVVGDGFVGWAEDGLRLVLTPTAGGSATRPPGHLAPATSPSADRRLVAVVDMHQGRSVLTVLRVG